MKKKDEKIACRLKTSIGGQALLEGIMMRGPKRTAMAVRNTKGEIVLEEWDTVDKKPAKIWTLPLFRGMYGMYSSLKVGYKALMRSAVLSGLDELEEEAEKEKELKKLNKKRKKEGLPPLKELPEDEGADSPKDAPAVSETPADETPADETPADKAGAAASNETAEQPAAAFVSDSPSDVPEAEQTPDVDAKGAENAEDAAPAADSGNIDNISADETSAEETSADEASTDKAASDKAHANEEAANEASANEAKETERQSDGKKKSKSSEKGSGEALIGGAALIGTILGVALAVVLFILLPTYIYNWTLGRVVDPSAIPAYPKMLIQSLFEGVIRIAVFVGYMFVVSLLKDIRRTFMYHGAEHKTIFCYEAGLPLTVENVRIQRRFHPRCGTSFMIVMLIIGILIGSFIPRFYVGQLLPAPVQIQNLINNLLRTVCKLALLPITVGLGYEFIKYAGKHDNLLVRILSAPGLWMQRISTKEPDDSMIECAILAVEKVIPDDGSDRL